VCGALSAALLAAAVQMVLPTRYEAVAVVHVESAEPGLIDMTSEAAIAMSRRVTSEALDALGEHDLDIDQLERAMSAAVAQDSRLLRVTYTADRPRDAARGADALAHAYVAARSVDATFESPTPAVSGVVVDPARIPESASGPGLVVTTLGGLILGLLVATPIAARSTRTVEVRAS
jgi:capsular polysaccharide biosynthesis protein